MFVLHAVTSLNNQSAYRDTYSQHCSGGMIQWHPSDPAEMIVGYLLLGVLASCGNSSPPRQGDSQPPQPGAPAPNITLDTPLIVEGDIAVTERGVGSGLALNAFITAQESVWPLGVVPYRIDMDFGLPVFLDSQIENITQALRTIKNGVPCIEFM